MNESPLFHSSVNNPPSRKRLSPPVVAVFSRASAPSRTAFAPDAVATFPGLMMSGSSTERISSVDRHAAVESTAAVSSAAVRRAQKGRFVIYAIMRSLFLRSEAKVETEGEVRRRSEGLERGRRIAGRSKRLGVHTGVLRPDRPEVADGHRRDQAATTHVPRDERLRRSVRERHLAEAHEVAVLEEPCDRAARMLTYQHRARLLVQGCVAADQPRAVEATRAANALGVVVDLVPALVVHHR